MQTTRQRILQYLATNHLASAYELSRAFGMTPANVRHHLKLLAQENLVEITGQRTSGGRGRPTLVYALTSNAEGAELAVLADALWEEFISTRPIQQKSIALGKVAQRLVGVKPDGRSNLTQRLYEAIRRLRGMQFGARWEAHADGPQIILDRCPFSSLRERRPEICQLDAEIVNLLLGEAVEQVEIRSRTPLGTRHCIFQIKP